MPLPAEQETLPATAPTAPTTTPAPLPGRPALAGPWAHALAHPIQGVAHMRLVPPEQRFRAGSYYVFVAVGYDEENTPNWLVAVKHKGDMNAGRQRHRTKLSAKAQERIERKIQEVAVKNISRVGHGLIIGSGTADRDKQVVALTRLLNEAEIAWLGRE